MEFYRKDGKLDYPPEHAGRKSYVTVQGYAYSVPKVYCYMNAGRYYVLGEGPGYDQSSAMIMPDLTPYKSPLDGSVVSSRSQHRNHMRQHGVIEMGNEYPKFRGPQVQMDRAGYDIKRAMGR